MTGAPVEGTLGVRDGKVVVVKEGREGREVTAKSLGAAVDPLLTRTGQAARTAAVATKVTQPQVSSANLAALGIEEQMSTFTVNFPTAPYRTTNIGRAAELINGSLVQPGEVWSFNETVGERTEENGFVDGTMILDGRYQEAPGGGVSAVATTVFNAVFFAGVQPSSTAPTPSTSSATRPAARRPSPGQPGPEVPQRLGQADLHRRERTDSSVTITFYGTKKYDSVEAVAGPRTNVTEPEKREATGKTCVPQEPLEGFDIAVDRVFKNGGEEVKRQTFKTHYTPRDEVVCN
ncbi:hypothetical protein Shyd_72010 [Streptomyces hydrogenans]|uniref:Lipoprotein n=1 Tax=Streptomyces hydrogenans TaxID=1873719 RepID=A0ABQ3PLD1_9ACTN|nr:VanW family protein [Streptomyces hydrogenans]GHI25830.1 hypothetical protein Shyd_72010 [Streptomyces hydrogenans]